MVTCSFPSFFQSFKTETEQERKVLGLTMKSWCWPPGTGFQTVWLAGQLAGEPMHHISLRGGPPAKPGASASPPNPVGIQAMKNRWNIFYAVQCNSGGECAWHRCRTETQSNCTFSIRWQHRVINRLTALGLVKPGRDCSCWVVCVGFRRFPSLLTELSALIEDILPESKDQRLSWFDQVFTIMSCPSHETHCCGVGKIWGQVHTHLK